jgi:hypothetical protein
MAHFFDQTLLKARLFTLQEEGQRTKRIPRSYSRKALGDRDEPFFRPIMAVELLVEGEEALQAVALGNEVRLEMASHFGDEG